MNSRVRILLTVLASFTAPAALSVVPSQAQDVRLAQSREIEVYYDDYGRRVVADAWTGEIISVERPRRQVDRGTTGSLPPRGERQRRDRYYIDDPDDMVRLDRERARREGYVDDYRRVYRDQPYPGDDSETYEERAEFPPAAAPVAREPLPPQAGPSERLSPANPADTPVIGKKSDIKTAKLQILLDRAGASPGVIDGHMGGNVKKALLAYEELTGETVDIANEASLDAALEAMGGPAFRDYTITAEDAAGPYVASIPADYGEKAQLERMAYTSTIEMLGERFHMSESYLATLNPGANFQRPGTVIRVADPGGKRSGAVVRIVADKGREQVRAYSASGALVVAYPATIGSSDTPSPSGTVEVQRIALNPEYTYNPKLNFKQGNNDRVLRIPPGPNGPVGSVWIALSKPTYGIHGTPEPSKIGKTNSHGCVRLTNWDAEELAKLVRPGVTVEFVE